MSSQENKWNVPRKSIVAFRKTMMDWFRDNGKSYPWRETTSPYGILMAEMFLQRTQAKQVVAVYERFMARFPSPVELAAADTAEVEQTILPLGLKKKAKQLKETALQVIEKHDGQIPSDQAALLKLEGIGQYTAHAVSVFAFGSQLPLVDANAVRILGRVFGIQSTMRRPRMDPHLWNLLADMIPKGQAREFGWALIDFGNSVCVVRRPRCPSCPLSILCISAGAGSR